jgi:hypothetical protein
VEGRAEERIFVPLTREELFWIRLAPGLFAPLGKVHPLAWFWHHVTVTPRAHVTFLNARYQLYLNRVFHTTRAARWGHSICIPLNVLLLFYGLAQFRLDGAHPLAHGIDPFAPTGAVIFGVALATWYAALAASLRNALWGAVMIGIVASLTMLGNTLYGLAFTEAVGDRSWWLPTPWYFAPLLWMGVVSGAQAWSHIREPFVPPRANGTRDWIPVRDYIFGPEDAPLRGTALLARFGMVFVGSIWGAIDEWWASAKLLPYFVLEAMWGVGYKPAQRDELLALFERARSSGNPALDYVGVGGGAYLSELPDPVRSQAE